MVRRILESNFASINTEPPGGEQRPTQPHFADFPGAPDMKRLGYYLIPESKPPDPAAGPFTSAILDVMTGNFEGLPRSRGRT